MKHIKYILKGMQAVLIGIALVAVIGFMVNNYLLVSIIIIVLIVSYGIGLAIGE